MALRTSNGYPFTILAAVPSLRTGIKVAIYDRDDPATLIDILPDSRARKWIDELNEVGGGEFEIHEDDPKLVENPTILRPGNFARFYLDEVARFTIRLEDYDYVPAGDAEDSGRWIKVSGRGGAALLEDGLVYPEGSIAGNPDRDTTGLTPGEAFLDFKAEADARNSVVTAITPDFTDSLDSSNQPYNFNLAETARGGRDDLLKLIQRYAELGVDFDTTPDLQLKIYANGLGVDKSVQTVNAAPVILRIANNIRNLKATETALIKNALLIETPAGFFERIHAGSVSEFLRREGYISLGNTTDGDYIDRATDAAFARLADIQTAITVEVLDIEGHRPYVDYGKGDWVLAPNAKRELVRWRVRGVTISETDEGTPIFIPTINSVDAELEERLQKWMRTMTPGTLGGTASDVASPNTATVAGAAETAAGEVSDHVDAFLHPDELSDLADVDVTGLEDGDLLVYDSGAGDWVPLDFKIDLSTPPAANQILRYNSGSNTWEPDDESGGGGGGGITPIDPDSISDLVAWLEADAITGLVDNDPVATWADSHTSGNDFTQGTAGQRPLYKTGILNSLPVVRFDNSDDGLSSALSLTKPYTIIVVYSWRGTGNPSRRAVQGGSNWLMGPYQGRYQLYNGAFAIAAGPAAETDQFIIHSGFMTQQYGHHFVNGNYCGFAAGTTSMGTVHLGRGGGSGEPLDGDIAEVVIYDRAILDAERRGVEEYLRQKWDI